MTWTNIPNAAITTNKPIKATTGRALRDNVGAAFNGDTGAPRLQTAAIQDGAVTTDKLDVNASLEATARDAAAGAVGTYAFAWLNETSRINFGETRAGSLLRPAAFTSASGVNIDTGETEFPAASPILGGSGSGATAFSGTWLAMGENTRNTVEDSYPHTLWLRIA